MPWTNERDFLNKVKEEIKKVGWLDFSVEWIRNNLSPEDVFRVEDLESWAEENGYVHED